MQGIVLLFLLLVIPVGIYVFRTQNTGEIRSQAAGTEIRPEDCNSKDLIKKLKLKCKNGQVPVFVVKDISVSSNNPANEGNVKQIKTCECGDPSTTLAGSGTGTSLSAKTIAQRCNTSCVSDSACGEGMVCALVGGIGKCRNAECFGVDDCACYKVNTPTPTQTPKQCNTSCTTDVDCGETMVCIQDSDGQRKCRNPQCYSVNDCVCYKVSTPTPTPVPPQCNTTCSADVDCGGTMICVKSAAGNKCRNPQCFAAEDCLCYSLATTTAPVGGNYVNRNDEDFIPTATPRRVTRPNTEQLIGIDTPTPTIPPGMNLADILVTSAAKLPADKTTPPALTIEPFYNAQKQTNPVFLLIGLTDPDAELSITISPDNVMTTLKADSLGNWQYSVTKKLSNGSKQLTITARTARGGVTTKTEVFTVVGGFQLPVAAIVFVVLIACAVGAYVVYQMRKNNTPPPQNPYMSMTTPEFQQPASQPMKSTGQSQEASPYGFEKGRPVPPQTTLSPTNQQT
jgi:hypothetical protein